MTEHIGLQLLKPSRARLQPGDVFVMLPPDDLYLFGRVILVDMPGDKAPMPRANLIYVYRHRSATKDPDRDALKPDSLLLSPMYINRLPWSRGYFETVAHWPLEPDDLLQQHCFLSAWRGRYYDEFRNELPGPVEPVGDWGLHGYGSVDKQVSDALGIERAPDHT